LWVVSKYVVKKKATELTTMVNKGTETQQKTVPDNLPSILHGAMVGAGSLWPPKRRTGLS